MAGLGNLPPALKAQLMLKHQQREAKRASKARPRRKGGAAKRRVSVARAALRKVQAARSVLQRQAKALVRRIEVQNERVNKARGKLNSALAAARSS